MTQDADISDLTEAEARAELARLSRLLAAANQAYHGADDPEISDAEYDALKKPLPDAPSAKASEAKTTGDTKD